MTMQIQRTTVIDRTKEESTVELLFADSTDPETASEYVLIRVKAPHSEMPFLEELQLKAFHRMRELLTDEIQRLSRRVNHAL